MKKITIFVVLFILSLNSFTQVWLSRSSDESDKKFNKNRSFDNRTTFVISGDGKKGENTIYYKFKAIDKKAKDYSIFIKGNLKGKKLNGEAEVCYLSGCDYEYLIENLKNYTGSLFSFFKEKGLRPYQYYKGEFKNNSISYGHFQYSGTTEELKKEFAPYLRKHLQEVFTDIEGLDFEYNYYGTYKLDNYDNRYKMSDSDSIVILDFKKDRKYVIKSVFNDLIFSKDIYEKNNYIGSEVFNANHIYSVGWRSRFYDNSVAVSLEGKTRTYNDIPFHILDLKQKHSYNGGCFYGELKDGKPSKYGVLINDDFFYQGFFNDAGEFDGYGFYQHLKPHPKYDMCISSTCLGVFKSNKIVSGEVSYNWAGSWVLAGDSIVQDFDFPVDIVNRTDKPLFDRYNLKGFSIYGNGEMTEIDYDYKHGGWFSEITFQKGDFKNNVLDGYGCKMITHVGKENEFICTYYENGEFSRAYRDSVGAEYKKLRKLQMDSLFSEVIYNAGSIIKKGSSYYYVNELKRKGKANVISLPIQKTDATKDGFFKKGDDAQIYYSSVNKTLASPYFGWGHYTNYEDMHNYELTNLALCGRCNGYGKIKETHIEHGSNVESTTTREVIHDGDYYRVTGDVTRYKTRTYSVPVTVTKTCDNCNGLGCVKN